MSQPAAKKKQARTSAPRETLEKKKKTTSLAAPAVGAPVTSTGERQLALAGLALIALVLASCSLVYLLSRTDDRWTEAR